MIYVARTDLFANSIVIIGSPGIYYRSAGFTYFWLSKAMSGAILQSDGIAWYIIGIFFDNFETTTREVFRDSTAFTSNVEFLSSIHAINLDSARTAYQIYIDPSTGAFSYDSIPLVLHSIDTIYSVDSVIVVDSVFVSDTLYVDAPDVLSLSGTITDLGYKGITSTFLAHQNQAFGDVCYINNLGKCQIVKADVIATSSALWLCVSASVSAGTTGSYLMLGRARNDAWNWTAGQLLYITITGTTGNSISSVRPIGTDQVVEIIGQALSTNTIIFFPNLMQIELR